MSFESGLESVFSKIFAGVKKVTTVAKDAESGLALIPGYGPLILAGIQMAVGLESLAPSAGSGTPANDALNKAKAALAVPVMMSSQLDISQAQAEAVLAALVSGFNNAAKVAASFSSPATSAPAAPASA